MVNKHFPRGKRAGKYFPKNLSSFEKSRLFEYEKSLLEGWSKMEIVPPKGGVEPRLGAVTKKCSDRHEYMVSAGILGRTGASEEVAGIARRGTLTTK